MAVYQGRKGKIRFYDSTGTPFYFELNFEEMDATTPWGRPRSEETLILDRENLSTLMHYITVSERVIAEPVEISFSARLDSSVLRTKLRQVVNAASSSSPWTVGSDSWVTTKGDSILLDVDGNSIATPAFSDTRKTCVNVEVLWDEGANDIGVQCMEVYFDPGAQEIADGEEAVIISLTGQVFGAIAQITAFTAGTAS